MLGWSRPAWTLDDVLAGAPADPVEGGQEAMAMIMLVLGLLLLATAIVLIVAVVVEGTDVVAVEVFNVGLDTTIWGVFVGGVATGVIAFAGLAALKLGIQQIRPRRAHHRRRRGRRLS